MSKKAQMIIDSNRASLRKYPVADFKEERDLSIVRLEQIGMVSCSLNNTMDQVRLFPLIRPFDSAQAQP